MITIELKKGELLWGGRVHEGTKMPYAPGFTADLHQPLGNQENFLLLSNMGRVIYSDRPFVFTVGEDKVFLEPDGEVVFGSPTGIDPLDSLPVRWEPAPA